MTVKGKEALKKRFRRFENQVLLELKKAMEKAAKQLVAEMKAIAPLPEIAKSIKWGWGDAPSGSYALATSSGGGKYKTLKITIYTDRDDAWFAHFFEFGTEQRVRKEVGGYFKGEGVKSTGTGQIIAQPFFFPTYRANRKRIKSSMNRALNRAVKKVNAT